MEEDELVHRLRAQIAQVQRPELLKLLAAGINDMTICGRSHYDSPDMIDGLRRTNEAIHRLSGHLRDLCDPDETLTSSRAEAISELLGSYAPSAISRFFAARA
jgi:hypothetical protein